jgi:hypothetical protein
MLNEMYDHNKTITIPISKVKTAFVIVGCFAFVLMAISSWFISNSQTRYPPVFIKMISVVCVMFFGSGMILGFKKLFDKRAGLIIDNKGLQDNTSISDGRFIAWDNITGFEMTSVRSTKIILVFINNSDKMIFKESRWKQGIMRQSKKLYGTPISLGSGTLKIKADELLELLHDRHISIKKL